MEKLNDKKAERTVSSKVVKTKKDFSSKIDSGVSKKSSALTLVKSRQPSNVSRATIKQSNFSTSTTQPGNSISSSRFTHSSKQSIIDDKPQQGVHQLGHRPSYLRGKRPVSAAGKLKATESETKRQSNKAVEGSEATKKFPNNTGKQYGIHAPSKAVLDGIAKRQAPLKKPDVSPTAKATHLEHVIAKLSTETGQIDSEIKAGCPPCEGEGSGAAAAQQAVLLGKELELSEVHGKMKQLEETCDRLDKDCKQKHDQISELEAVVAVKTSMVKEREDDIDKLKHTVENLRLISTSRDSLFREELQEVDHKMAALRRELAQKCNDLIKYDGKIWTLNERIEDLNAKLVQAGSALEEKEKQLIESLKKETERDSKIEQQSIEIDACRQHSEKLTQRIDQLNQEIADKDSLIAALKSGDPQNIVQTELEAQKMRIENNTPGSVKQPDDILLRVRSKLLENLENSKEAFKARYAEMLSYEGCGETGVSNRTQAKGCDVLFQTVADKLRQCGKEEQIISEIERNNQKCRAVRNKLLKMVKQLRKENRQMHNIIRNNSGQFDLSELYKKPTKDDSQLKDELLNQICRLVPEEPVQLKQTMEQYNVEEKILNRISCDENWSEDDKTNDAESY